MRVQGGDFSDEGPLGPTWACHGSQCRNTSGHYWASTEVPNAQLRLIKDGGLKWYRSSEQARRGFCVACGSSLFWQEDGEDIISVGAGTFDELPCDATTVVKHIFMAGKGAYYDVTNGLPQSDAWETRNTGLKAFRKGMNKTMLAILLLLPLAV